MGGMAATATIDEVLDAFLIDQRKRLSVRTMRNYEDVVTLSSPTTKGNPPRAALTGVPQVVGIRGLPAWNRCWSRECGVA